jgi:NADPH:quinone reductase-like Zn-dependent oxidoreductase
MKAAVHTRYGPPEVVQVKDIPAPVPKASEVLIHVHASTVNRTDCGFRSAEYFISRFFSGLFKPKQTTLGNEFAGVISAIGPGVTQFKIGDCVFGYNDQQFGAHAEYMLMPQDGAMALMPEGMPFTTAAALTEGSHYALVDIRAANVKQGDDVLVYGATGAIGSAAVQLLKYFGARVTAVCATPHVPLVQSLGADVVIDYLQEDYTTRSQRYDFVFDSVGKSSFGQAKKVLKEKGIYISTELGKNGENVWKSFTTRFGSGPKLLFPLPTASRQDIEFLKTLAEQGHFKPLIDRIYPLDQIVEAYRYVESRQKLGNVIIQTAG